jgi:1,2-diacylglycerol 3-alpha-glucosyltransferase
MKIVMVCEFFDPNLQYQENLLLQYYRKANHEVLLLTSTYESIFDFYQDRHDSKLPRKEFQTFGATVIRLPYSYNIFNRLRKLQDITGILNPFRPDIIFLHDISLNVHEAIAYKKRNPKCSIIMDFHADYSNSGKNWISLKILHGLLRNYLFLRTARKYLDKIFPVVPQSELFLKEVYGVEAHEMELLPLGVDVDLGNAVRQKCAGKVLRSKLGIPENDFVVITGGKLNQLKKTDLLIDAVLSLNSDRIHLIIIGKPESDDFKMKLDCIIGTSSFIHQVGWLDKQSIYEHLDSADIAVFPASQSVLWQQSISMGLPLVVGNTGGQSIGYLNKYKNIIELSVEDINTETLMFHIKNLSENPDLCETMRCDAFRITDEMLDWNKLIQKTLDFVK